MYQHLHEKVRLFAFHGDNTTASESIRGFDTEADLEAWIEDEHYGNDEQHRVIDIALVMEQVPNMGE